MRFGIARSCRRGSPESQSVLGADDHAYRQAWSVGYGNLLTRAVSFRMVQCQSALQPTLAALYSEFRRSGLVQGESALAIEGNVRKYWIDDILLFLSAGDIVAHSSISPGPHAGSGPKPAARLSWFASSSVCAATRHSGKGESSYPAQARRTSITIADTPCIGYAPSEMPRIALWQCGAYIYVE